MSASQNHSSSAWSSRRRQRLIIDWPLTPYTGWGGYGIQLTQALMARGDLEPVLTYSPDRTTHCDPHWIAAMDYLENGSQELINHFRKHPHTPVRTNAEVALNPIGNQVPALRCQAAHQVAVTFFESGTLSSAYLKQLDPYELVITGSRWNQNVLEQAGFQRAVLVHQGIDPARFNPVPVPRLFQRSLVVFSGGKLEARKGQDIVVEAFRRLLRHLPDALLIPCWNNLGEVGLDTIGHCDHVQGVPSDGGGPALLRWLESNGLPRFNVMTPPQLVNSQLPNLIKQADVAVFVSRCEGGTNLMAMESLACGVPTLVSANTGHLDLIALNLEHCQPVGATGLGRVKPRIAHRYGGDVAGAWGETDPEEVLEGMLRIAREKQAWQQRGQRGAAGMGAWSWGRSMAGLLNQLEQHGCLEG